jgi:hypothetical protein
MKAATFSSQCTKGDGTSPARVLAEITFIMLYCTTNSIEDFTMHDWDL